MDTLRLRGRVRPEGSVRVTAMGLLLFLGLAGPGFAAGCGQPVEPGQMAFTVRTGGIERPALAHIPTAYDGKTKLAVVFDFHGSNSGPAGQFRRSGWDAVAEHEGFVSIALQGSLDGQYGGTHAWNVPGVTHGGTHDDERYIKDAIKTVKDRFCVDPTRIYASGYSGGGRMLSQYICNGHPEFAAAGFVMGLRAGYPVERGGVWQPDVASCKPGNPISIIAFSGMKDVTNPFAGGGKPYWQYGGETALQRWAELDKCEGKGNVTVDAMMTALSFNSCAGGARINSYLLKENTHAWPARSVLFRTFDANGKVTSERDATGRMWEFFKNTRSPEETPLTAGDATERSG
ncbi:polyhydroxybutyrate depolymerase [Sinorhizobium sp. RAC02]|uniref:alpha/beta hydrolase family esterase n=1 Tax=Sinorhizobium sp. RAC02 TaxID=1842534 RepID=UPI001237733D|nr:polyhydroxybutyrate depolymerase [Sinorhizobium sp. RAC02]